MTDPNRLTPIPESLDLDTPHGYYQATPWRAGEGHKPAGATHTVFADGGGIAGYAGATAGYAADGTHLGQAWTLQAAAELVAAHDAGQSIPRW